MTLRRVRYYGDPVLRQRAQEITEFDASLKSLIEDMRETMKAYNGVGLAANQIGVLQRVLVVDVPMGDAPRAMASSSRFRNCRLSSESRSTKSTPSRWSISCRIARAR